jgi:hypothetical protein
MPDEVPVERAEPRPTSLPLSLNVSEPFARHPRRDHVERFGAEHLAAGESQEHATPSLLRQSHVEQRVVLLGKLGEPFDGGRVEHG